MKLGSNIIDIQKKNRCVVLEALLSYSEISRVDLVQITQLNKATITNIIHEFQEYGIVENIGQIKSKNGRGVQGLRLQMQETVSVILCIRKEYLTTAICDVHGNLTNFSQVYYKDDTDIQMILEQYRDGVEKQLQYCEKKNLKVLGLSVATLGWLLKDNDKYIIRADGVEVLGEVDIKQAFIDMFPNLEIWVDHDANMSALAEWNEFKEDKPETLLSIVGGIGFGGGIIIHGEIFSGYNGIAGEVGHMGIDCMSSRNGRNSDFHGLWESYASPRQICGSVREHRIEYPDTVLSENPTLEEIYAAYDEGDPLAEKVVNRAARYMAYGLTSLIFILNPEVIILGDEIIRSEKYEKQLYKYMKRLLPSDLFRTLNIKFSKLDKNGILVGAGLAMVRHYLRTGMMIDFLADSYKK